MNNWARLETILFKIHGVQLLGVKITKDDQRNLIEKYKGKHVTYWKSRWLTQRRLEDFLPEAELALSQKEVKPMYVLLPTKEMIDG